MSKMNRIIALLMCSVTLFGLTACGNKDDADPLLELSKQELVDYIRVLEDDVTDLTDRNTELETLMAGVQGETTEVPIISEFSDGTGRKTLNSVDSIVKLPTIFAYPHSVQTLPTSCVKISENISIKPNANWVVNVNGNTTTMEHTSSQISGQFVVGELDVPVGEDKVRPEDLTTVINTFFESMPPENISYTRVYADDYWVGMDASCHTFINEQDANIRCGMINHGDTTLCYMFAYKGSKDASKDELILNILKGMVVNNRNIVLN